MQKTVLHFLSFCFLLLGCQQEEPIQNTGTNESPLFQKVPASSSGLSFVNTIKEHPQLNHFFYNYIYNGGGIALGDINNDGLPDLFCTGNQVPDKLYLNKGNLTFEDITGSAGIIEDKFWSTGVTMADVNSDGWLDIYVCRGGPYLRPEQRKNLLYINNKNNTFSEKAKSYGLDNGGYGTQAVFFDLDNDEDLDLYLANTPADVQIVLGMNLPKNVINEFESDRLYQNTGNNSFIDISKQAGITSYAYALNVVASDLNQDGWVDLLVTNDFDAPDFYYINNGDLTFRNEANTIFKHHSLNSMGSDIADFNNDGHQDVVVLDMAAEDHVRSKTNMPSMRPETFWNNVNNGKHYQYMFNTLQLNNGNGSFSEIGQLANIAKTDWSWGALFADFDNDGWKDLLVTNGIKKDMRNNDILAMTRQAMSSGGRQLNWSEIVQQTPSVPLPNYLFKNNHDFTFSKVTKEWGVHQAGFSNGLAVADLDNDGDLDFVTNDIDAPIALYENKNGNTSNYIRLRLQGAGSNTKALNAMVKIHFGDQIQIQEITPTRGYLSASETIVHFGLGQQEAIDEITIRWPSGRTSRHIGLPINQLHTIKESEVNFLPLEVKKDLPTLFAAITDKEKLDYRHQENEFDDFEKEILLPHKQSQNGPFISSADVNGDSLEDFFIGGAAGYPGKLFIQKQDGSFIEKQNESFRSDEAMEDLGSLFLDFDGDGDLDLYVCSGGNEFPALDKHYQDRLYRNDGKGSFTKTEKVLPKFSESTQVVKAADIDKDGDLDLFIGGRLVPGAYPQPASSYLLLNENGQFKEVADDQKQVFKKLGMVTDAIFADYDNDLDEDLIIVGEWMNVEIFQNDKGQFTSKTKELNLADSRGWWWSVEAADFDKDGDVDVLLGNLGENTKFKTSPEKPFSIYGNDFDQNGTNDIVLANHYKDKIVPVRGRECSSEQMPFITQKFPSYADFANASIQDMFAQKQLEEAIHYQVHSFESILLKNDNGKFSKHPLPMEAQFSPIRDMLVQDFNKDGHLDVLAIGNLYPTEVETPRYDAGTGILLLGKGDGQFEKEAVSRSGFFSSLDGRSLEKVGNYILVGNNGDRVQVFKENN